MQSIKGADRMQNLKIHETTYSKIFTLDEGTLMKYSFVKKSAWEIFLAFNVSQADFFTREYLTNVPSSNLNILEYVVS